MNVSQKTETIVSLMALNHDSSWQLVVTNLNEHKRIWIDPWLDGEQVDGAAWFSRQRHALPALAVSYVGVPDVVILSHPFTDHCHKETLLMLPPATQIIAVPAAYKIVQQWKYFHNIRTLPPVHRFDVPGVDGCQVSFFPAPRLLDWVHNALVFHLPNGKTLVYAPHGCTANLARAIRKVVSRPIDVLITTHTRYELPIYLGGTVNLGIQKMAEAAAILQTGLLLGTHDEAKHAFGLVSRLARVAYASKPHIELKKYGYSGSFTYSEIGKPIVI